MEFKMNIDWNVVLVIMIPIGLGILYFLVKRLIENPTGIYAIFPSIQPMLEIAIKFAANQVEYLEKSGELAGFIDPYKDKGEEKLRLAVDLAVQYLEKYLLDTFGLTIDLPESLIKDAIQVYVWNNPDLFPSSAIPVQAYDSPVQTLEYPVTDQARIQPANYPANLYVDEPNIGEDI
jgi:hypothetical protein